MAEMYEIMLFAEKKLAEKVALQFLERYIKTPIDSLDHRRKKSNFFFSIIHYSQGYKTLITLTSTLKTDELPKGPELATQLSVQFQTDIIYELTQPLNGKEYVRQTPSGQIDNVNIEELDDGLRIIEKGT